MTTPQMDASVAAREIVSSRVINASPEAVFAAFADPARLARWWGPSGFTNTFETFEFRAGGNWRFVMHGPDGTNYPNESVFKRIEAPALIVFDHVCAPLFTMTITLQDRGGQTCLTWRMLFESAQLRDAIAKYAVPGNEQNFDRLQAELGLHQAR